jgi:hypothetical protein
LGVLTERADADQASKSTSRTDPMQLLPAEATRLVGISVLRPLVHQRATDSTIESVSGLHKVARAREGRAMGRTAARFESEMLGLSK